MRKYLRQTNGFSDKGTKFAGTDDCGVNAVSQNGKYPVSCKQGAFLLCKNARANKRFHRYSGKVRSGSITLVSFTQVKQLLAHRLPGLLHHSALVSGTQVEQRLAHKQKAKVFSHLRKYLRQTNGFSDKGTKFAGTDDCGVNAVSQNGKYPVSCKQGAFLLCKNARANKRFHRYSGKVRSGSITLVSFTQVKQLPAHRLAWLCRHAVLVSGTQVEQWLAQIRADNCPRLDEEKVFSRMRKYLRQTNGFPDQSKSLPGPAHNVFWIFAVFIGGATGGPPRFAGGMKGSADV